MSPFLKLGVATLSKFRTEMPKFDKKEYLSRSNKPKKKLFKRLFYATNGNKIFRGFQIFYLQFLGSPLKKIKTLSRRRPNLIKIVGAYLGVLVSKIMVLGA